MVDARLFLITGVMAAGKSTVSQALAERFPRSVHVRGDGFRRAVINGRHEMGANPTPEALAQLRLRYRLALSAAETYADAGFTTVLQDVVIGPMLDEVVAMIEYRPATVVVLAPRVEVVAKREAGRVKSGYGAVTPSDLDRVLRQETTRLGHWLDTSDLTVEQTVDRILELDPTADL